MYLVDGERASLCDGNDFLTAEYDVARSAYILGVLVNDFAEVILFHDDVRLDRYPEIVHPVYLNGKFLAFVSYIIHKSEYKNWFFVSVSGGSYVFYLWALALPGCNAYLQQR